MLRAFAGVKGLGFEGFRVQFTRAIASTMVWVSGAWCQFACTMHIHTST